MLRQIKHVQGFSFTQKKLGIVVGSGDQKTNVVLLLTHDTLAEHIVVKGALRFVVQLGRLVWCTRRWLEKENNYNSNNRMKTIILNVFFKITK